MSASAKLVEKEIVERRDRLVSRRTDLLGQRAAIISELRQIDGELKDCEATARFFGLSVEFPPDEREEYERIRSLHREREMREREVMRARQAREVALQSVMQLEAPAVPDTKHSVEAVALPIKANKGERSRPTVREVSINLLEGAGKDGMRAGNIRDYLDRAFGMTVHEKTVGMTLYRLSQEGVVYRVGHKWFFGPAPAESKNPGVEAPGSVDGSS